LNRTNPRTPAVSVFNKTEQTKGGSRTTAMETEQTLDDQKREKWRQAVVGWM